MSAHDDPAGLQRGVTAHRTGLSDTIRRLLARLGGRRLGGTLMRRIMVVHLLALYVLVVGIVLFERSHDRMTRERVASLQMQADLIAGLLSANNAPVPDRNRVAQALRDMALPPALGIVILDTRGRRIAERPAQAGTPPPLLRAEAMIQTPGGAVGAVVLSGPAPDASPGIWSRLFWAALATTLMSAGLGLLLARVIVRPLAELATAVKPGGGERVRIPDLTHRADEIGQLSGALRGMVSALYHRIDANEQFAADVAHEIKNPLASLRSAVGAIRIAPREGQREQLLNVIEHDVRRLDRLVSDISNASRLDSELVREEQERFDLLDMLGNLTRFLHDEAGRKGIELITDFPDGKILITGLEGRLAQVFVNLITNAISFCEDGDAIRVWARKRANRVVIVVEDTGPGIGDSALAKIFQRFYSHRSDGDFGNHSGLGLSISKQIVEAHDGVIWAENIRPTDADITSDPLGARFVVGLPL